MRSRQTRRAAPLGVGFAGAQDILPQSWDEQTALSSIKKVPKEVVRNVLCGTPDEILERAAEWRAHGVRYLVLSDVTALAAQRPLGSGCHAVLLQGCAFPQEVLIAWPDGGADMS